MSTEQSITGFSTGEDVFEFSAADNEVVLANISDYGNGSAAELNVANLVSGWRPDAIFTNGDNSYSTLYDYDTSIGLYYGDYVDRNLVIPSPGNHDWDDGTLAVYLAYFAGVVKNRYYYKQTIGPVSLFMLDSNSVTPDGNTISGAQYQWLAGALAASRSPWNIVAFHHPPFTSGIVHDPEVDMRWGFGALGADMVFNGHNHQYERLYSDTYYIVNGAGGSSLYNFTTPASQSQFRYNTYNGAGKLIATPNKLKWEFFNYLGASIDTLTLEK